MENQNIQLRQVEDRIKQTKDRRMYERYQAIRLYLMGNTMKQIQTILGRTDKTIKSYIHKYEEHGLDGLNMKFSPGKPTRLSKEQQNQLKQTILDHVPNDVGFPAKYNWTLDIISAYIEREFKHTYSLRGVSKLMHRMDMSYTKPTYTLAAADEEKQKEFVETTFPRLKKLRKWRN
jgi:transposase